MDLGLGRSHQRQALEQLFSSLLDREKASAETDANTQRVSRGRVTRARAARAQQQQEGAVGGAAKVLLQRCFKSATFLVTNSYCHPPAPDNEKESRSPSAPAA
jgi:hypothetical protein